MLLGRKDLNRIWLLRKVLQPDEHGGSVEFLLGEDAGHQEQPGIPRLHESIVVWVFMMERSGLSDDHDHP